MPATETKILNIARSQIGYRERSGNRTKYGAWYGLDGVSWCDTFISWVGAQARASDIIGRAAYTPAHAAWFKAIGRWGHTPRRGAIAFFDFPDSVRRIQHVGIVESVRSDGRIVTIEGNTSGGAGGSQSDGGGVWRRVRSRRLVVGYGYPAYGRETAVRAVAKTASPKSAGVPPLTIDGVWGANTTRAMQRWLDVSADGQIGPKTKRALQRKLNVRQDGSWGPQTRKALQKALAVKQDGAWGKQTVRSLQRKLNDGWR